MPENNSSRSLLYRSLDLLSTEELEEVLRTGQLMTGDEASDEEVLITIADLLLERETQPGRHAEEETEAALEAFWRDTAQDAENHARAVASRPKRSGRKWRYWIAGAAAMLAVGLPTAQAFHLDLIRIVQQLIAGQFSFVSDIRTADTTDLAKFQKLLDRGSVPLSLEGLWLPEGFASTEATRKDFLDFTIFQLKLEDREKNLFVIDIVCYHNDTYNRQLETVDTAAETYETENRVYYILRNDQNVSAAFFEKNMEVTLSGDVSIEDLHKIIDSIG